MMKPEPWPDKPEGQPEEPADLPPEAGQETGQPDSETPVQIFDLRDKLLLEALAAAADEQPQRRRVWPFRLVAILLSLALLLLTFAGLVRLLGLPPMGLLIESGRLTRDAAVRDWTHSVVAVSADDRRGTGFVLTPDGLVVTNQHIVADARQVTLHFGSGENHQAEEWAVFETIDLVLIPLPESAAGLYTPSAAAPLEGARFAGLKLAGADLPQTGDSLTLIGNPLGFFRIASRVEYVGLARTSGWPDTVLAIRGAVYHGNSGSPVINEDGEVIGVLFAVVRSEDKADEVIGLVIPARNIRQAVAAMRQE